MDKKLLFDEIKNLLSYLTKEHKEILKEGENLKLSLGEDLNTNLLKKLDNFFKKVNKHAYIEENDLGNLVEKANITDFDIEAVKFGHRTLEEIEEYIRFLIEEYKKGNDTYKGKTITQYILNEFDIYLKTLKDHFNEEEFFFFKDIFK